jgi:hypothetical protein
MEASSVEVRRVGRTAARTVIFQAYSRPVFAPLAETGLFRAPTLGRKIDTPDNEHEDRTMAEKRTKDSRHRNQSVPRQTIPQPWRRLAERLGKLVAQEINQTNRRPKGQIGH